MKLRTSFVALALLIALASIIPFADASAAGIEPYAIGTVTASKRVSGKTITGDGYAVFGTTEKSASMTIYLQQKVSGSWVTVKTGSTKTASNVSSLAHSYAFSVSSGEYRIKVTASSTNSGTAYSSSVTI